MEHLITKVAIRERVLKNPIVFAANIPLTYYNSMGMSFYNRIGNAFKAQINVSCKGEQLLVANTVSPTLNIEQRAERLCK